MKDKYLAVILMVICTLFTSSAQLLYKEGANRLSFSVFALITNWPILLGLMLYGIGAVLLITALRKGKVTVLFPIIATSYIWVALGSSYFFGEIINGMRWIGIGLIIIGIVMINIADNEGGGNGN